MFELLGSCLVIPLAEELLYRGVVERRLSLLCGSAPAIVLSAVIFGVMHWNVVQFLYAGILGLLLAWLLERTGFFVCARSGAYRGECDGGCAQRDWLAGLCLPAHSGRCCSDGAAVCGGSVCGSAGEKRAECGRKRRKRPLPETLAVSVEVQLLTVIASCGMLNDVNGGIPVHLASQEGE